MAKILFLVHRIPYPPNKGDKIRSYEILKALSADNQVTLGAFVDDQDDWQHRAVLESLCEDVYLEGLNPSRGKVKSLAGLLTGSPLTVTYYRSPSFQRWVDTQIKSDAFDCIILFSSAMARFIQFDHVKAPVWMDFVDLDSDKWRQYAASKTFPESWIYSREASRLERYEQGVARQCAKASFVTEPETKLFLKTAGEAMSNVLTLPNGVDLRKFSPEFDSAQPLNGQEIVFSGAMDYWANVDAITWFAREVFPLVREAKPGATFTIAGARPTADVLALAEDANITATGFVDDMRIYLGRAGVCVAPMRIARGVQNKVLEAMAMGKAVVSTTAGFDGIQAVPGRDLWVEDSADAFAHAVVTCLDDSDQARSMGRHARIAMEQSYDWNAALAPMLRFAKQSADGN